MSDDRATAAAAVATIGLSKTFGEVRALNQVDLRLPTGQVLGVLGPNGAGKTTLIRILATLTRPDSGEAWVSGLDVVRQSGRVRRVIGLSGQHAAVDGYLTAAENLTMIGKLARLGGQAKSRADELIEVFGLSDAAGRQARTYSGGMRRRLDVAASVTSRPEVLFLDEPTTGLDLHGRVGLWRLVREMVAEGTSVLLTTQYLEEADQLSDRIVVLDGGSVVAEGTPDQLKDHVGGSRLELRLESAEGLDRLRTAMEGLGSAPPSIDRELKRLVVPVSGGLETLADAVGRLSRAGIGVSGLSLRRPTLDDVFVALTGRKSDES